MENKLTVLISANLIPTHPSIKFIKSVIISLELLKLPKNIKIILSHDNIKETEKTDIEIKKYKDYFKNLEDYCKISDYINIQIILNNEWGHLSGSFKNALNYINTPYILVLQHDLPFIRKINDIKELIILLENNPNIKHIKFNKRQGITNWDGANKKYLYRRSFLKTYTFNINNKSIKLMRTLCWSDQNHLVSKEYCFNIIKPLLTEKTFPEAICNPLNTAETHDHFGTYMYVGQDDNNLQYIAHLDGARTTN